MKKNKTQDQTPRDFTNRPFAGLKQASPVQGRNDSQRPRPAPARTPVEKPAPGPAELEDDVTLFLRAAAGTRRIGTNPAAPQSKSGGPALSPQDDDEQQRLFLAAVEKLGTAAFTSFSKPLTPEQKETGPSSRMRFLKRGAIRISEELDLHGDVKEEALRRLEHFITGAHHRGRKAVLVITGKGINSPDGPVLQGAVADWLRNAGKKLVSEFAKAPRDKGGSGAFVVFLRPPSEG